MHFFTLNSTSGLRITLHAKLMGWLSNTTEKSVSHLERIFVIGLKSCPLRSKFVATMNKNESWDVVYSYSRAQAIADGVLVDVTEQAKAVGFKLHTVVTDHLFHGCVEPPAGCERQWQTDPYRQLRFDPLFLKRGLIRHCPRIPRPL